MTPTLAAIHIFPLKSCAPLSVTEADVQLRGLRHDRRWLAIDHEAKFITARQCARLTLVRARPIDAGLQLDAPGMPTLIVPLPSGPERISAVIWNDTVAPLPASAEAAQWLSEFLARDCRVVYMDDACVRPTDPARARPGDEVSFADSHPLLLLSQGAVDHLNSRLATPVPAMRFRPNLLVAGTMPHAEDGWKRIRVGEVEFELEGPSVRCVFTTIDFEKGERDPNGEPLKTLVTYRRTPRGVTFGQNLTPRSVGKIRVGDAVEIVE